eukprot:scaffold17751_cov227-Isochrysis_galbana.AAC.3
MTDPPTDDREDREPDAPDPTDSESHTPLHGPTGGVPSDTALSDTVARQLATFGLWRRRRRRGRPETETETRAQSPRARAPEPEPERWLLAAGGGLVNDGMKSRQAQAGAVAVALERERGAAQRAYNVQRAPCPRAPRHAAPHATRLTTCLHLAGAPR